MLVSSLHTPPALRKPSSVTGLRKVCQVQAVLSPCVPRAGKPSKSACGPRVEVRVLGFSSPAPMATIPDTLQKEVTGVHRKDRSLQEASSQRAGT